MTYRMGERNGAEEEPLVIITIIAVVMSECELRRPVITENEGEVTRVGPFSWMNLDGLFFRLSPPLDCRNMTG